jgi:hypothetical protein
MQAEERTENFAARHSAHTSRGNTRRERTEAESDPHPSRPYWPTAMSTTSLGGLLDLAGQLSNLALPW